MKRNAPSPTLRDKLARLELRIAKRADELARAEPHGHSSEADREMWLRAERELFPSGDLALSEF